MTLAFRGFRYSLATRLVRGHDGLLVNTQAWQASLDRLAALSEWAHNTPLSRGLATQHESVVEDVTRMLVLAAEICNPDLSFEEIQKRYVNIRLRAMGRRRRQRLQYEQALKTLEANARVRIARAKAEKTEAKADAEAKSAAIAEAVRTPERFENEKAQAWLDAKAKDAAETTKGGLDAQ